MRILVLLLCAAFSTGLVQAQSAYRWVDKDGKVHYGDRPPAPDTVKTVEEKRLSAPGADVTLPFAVREAASRYPVTLYVGADCGACDEGRTLLKKRSIPFSEKRVETSEDIDALKKLLGGSDVMVPTLLVGTRSSRGYLDSAWSVLLDNAGYPKQAVR